MLASIEGVFAREVNSKQIGVLVPKNCLVMASNRFKLFRISPPVREVTDYCAVFSLFTFLGGWGGIFYKTNITSLLASRECLLSLTYMSGTSRLPTHMKCFVSSLSGYILAF